MRDRLASDRGYALASTVLLSGVVLIMAAFIVTRVVEMAQNVFTDRQWENALQVADSGIDYAAGLIAEDPDYTTGHDQLADRDAVIAAAQAVEDGDVVTTPQGEFVLIVPASGDVVYSVGFVPTRADADRIRVVRSAIEGELFEIDVEFSHAFLTGGDVKIEAKKDHKDVEILGLRDWAHANGSIEFKKDKSENNINAGCLTSYADQYSNEADDSNVDCPDEGEVPFAEIPEIDPIQLHFLSQYDICPNGTIRHGPASPESGVTRATAGEPCTGGLVFGTRGVKHVDDWDKKVEFKSDEAEPGVYFVWGRSAKVKVEKEESLQITVITAKPDNDLMCQHEPGGVKLKKDQYGDVEVEVKDRARLQPHPAAAPYTVVAAGDIKMKVKGKDKSDDDDDDEDKDKRGTAEGLYLSHEQVKLESNAAESGDDYDDDDGFDDDDDALPKGAVHGAIVAQDACDTEKSKVKKQSEIKKGDIVFDPDYAGLTHFVVEDGGVLPRTRREL